MTNTPFILASSSPRRLSLLATIGIIPNKVIAPDLDETPLSHEKPRELAYRLAHEKLLSVAKMHNQSYIIAADTVVAVGRRILPKAENGHEVRECLHLMSGRRHHVYTGVALSNSEGKILRRVSDSTVIFRRLSHNEIEAYVQSGEGIGKAGGYSVQGHAQSYIRFMSGSYSGIMGLPLFDVS